MLIYKRMEWHLMESTNRILGNIKRYIDVKEPEVQITGFLTIVLALVFSHLKVFENFSHIEDIIQSILTGFIGGFIGLLGIVLAGVAIIIGLFSKKEIKLIQNINHIDLLAVILDSFKFCAISLGLEIIYLSTLAMIISTPEPLVEKSLFHILLVITLYGIIFNLFYVISLMNECIELYKLKQEYEDASKIKKSLLDKANEQRIDFILSKLIDKQGVNPSTFMKELLESIDKSNIENKEEIKQYLKEYYN